MEVEEEKKDDGEMDSLGSSDTHGGFSFSLRGAFQMDKLLSSLHKSANSTVDLASNQCPRVSMLMGDLPPRVPDSNAFGKPGFNEVNLVSLVVSGP